MNLLTMHSRWRLIPSAFPHISDSCTSYYLPIFIPNQLRSRNCRADIRRALSSRVKKTRVKGLKRKENTKLPNGDLLDKENNTISSVVGEAGSSKKIPSRVSVLQACTVTSGLMGLLGLLIRQVSHASQEGLPIADCSAEFSWDFQVWHLKLIMGLVVLVSSGRYLLLKTCPDFAESSEAANRQVLTSLEPFDYIVVSFLPGVSEEFLFRGALLPLFGVNWPSVLAVAAVFGILHLGSGRKYSFAIWATFVGLVYGYATMLTSSITVAMAAHSLNNLVGGIIWRSTTSHSK
ncbi:unnamed protein product [Cuscuta epithymum]|uniref:CAAX prenyl protease 2/Lysostaphin resistance protein A-like domain-containing protein n=1 Tax=Cuscuta epithymum TaxID=186058 RepID=A0AAV0CKU1_9ASTE|nr:unnamed protein product [Cuscuta epithymum]